MALPRGVHVKAGRYYLVRQNRWIALSRLTEGLEALFHSLAEVAPVSVPKTVADLLMHYVAGGMSELAPITRKGYTRACAVVLVPTFGHMPVNALTESHVARFLETRKEAGVGPSGNRERATLSAAYEFGLRRGFVERNPCRGVRRNKETPRRHYVRNETLRAEIDSAPDQYAELLSAAYLSGIRQGDLIALKRENLTRDGIEFTESKTKRQRLVEWSPTLRTICDAAMQRADAIALHMKRPAPTRVFTNRFGQPWTKWAVQSQRRRQTHKFRFHDLRGKAASDAKHSVLGRHSSLSTYLKRETSKPVR